MAERAATEQAAANKRTTLSAAQLVKFSAEQEAHRLEDELARRAAEREARQAAEKARRGAERGAADQASEDFKNAEEERLARRLRAALH